MPDYGRKPALSRLDELISDIRSCLDADPPLPAVKNHGGCYVTQVYLKEAGIAAIAFLERCSAEGFGVASHNYGDAFTISK